MNQRECLCRPKLWIMQVCIEYRNLYINKCRQLICVPVGYTHKFTVCIVYAMNAACFIIYPPKWCLVTSVDKVYNSVSPTSRDRAPVWLLELLPADRPLSHSNIYGHTVRVCFFFLSFFGFYPRYGPVIFLPTTSLLCIISDMTCLSNSCTSTGGTSNFRCKTSPTI